MAVTDSAFTATDLAGFIPERWPGMINKELFAKATAANFFLDLSSSVTDGADIIHVPDVYTNAFTGQTQGTQGAEVTTEGPAQVDTTLTINTHKYVAAIIGDKDMAQLAAQYDYNMVYIEKMAGTLRTALEAALFGLWSGLSTSVIGDTATVVSDSEIRQAVNALDSYNFGLESDVAWFFHPYVYWLQLGAVSKYYDQSVAGPLSMPGFTRSGELGQGMPATNHKGFLYGIPVYTSTNVVSGLQTYRNLLAHKSAFGYATQTLSGAQMLESGRVRAQTNYELRNLGQLTVVDMIYGVAELRDTAAVVVNASNAFLGS